MMIKSVLAACVAVVVSCPFVLRDRSRQDGGSGREAAAALRARGPAALDELFRTRDVLIARRAVASGESLAPVDREIAALEALIDEVGAQKYCSASRLFWYTDYDAARAASVASGKPMLSLRMLGKLTDELSCANSRFFRTTLYPNREISGLLRERFVLHWASVRPVPQVTIDFGDGRKLHRTLTGNSIHYVIDSAGRVIDGLPGLHGPESFRQWLLRSADLAAAVAMLPPHVAALEIARFHRSSVAGLQRELQTDLLRAPPLLPDVPAGPAGFPSAEQAAKRALAKSTIEMPVLPAVTMTAARVRLEPGREVWDRIGALHRDDVRFDDDSIALIRKLNPLAGRRVDDEEAALLRLVRELQRLVAADSARNEHDFHRRLHEWLSDPAHPPAIEALNERVYDELFLTPRSDPWLGLLPDDVFTALADNGIEGPR